MKFQWTLILGLLAAVLIALFAIVNVEAVRVNLIVDEVMIPLVLIILGSALLGALISGLFAIFRSYQSNRKTKELEKQLKATEAELALSKHELKELQSQLGQAPIEVTDEPKLPGELGSH